MAGRAHGPRRPGGGAVRPRAPSRRGAPGAAPRFAGEDGEAAQGQARPAEAARRLFAQPCRFIAGAARLEQVPQAGLPEVAFAGRSNVGKSSLVNALTGRRTLAKVSHTPGRTQQLNFFDLGGRLILVDMPGYGYARAARDRVKAWGELVRLYLKGRPTLRRVCLLVDARHGLKEADRAVMRLMDEAAQSYQIVLTKADQLRPEALAAVVEAVAADAASHAAAHPEVLATSAHSGAGVAELRAALAAL
ncbi:MAG: YihA family ribosome biogenesis GTP-binding protein, partial [Rhodospirillaceae bacterium]|nr:YihA family ribosome biogenesis GTP-binding protein [Rhodospirillaceae bacterium]